MTIIAAMDLGSSAVRVAFGHVRQGQVIEVERESYLYRIAADLKAGKFSHATMEHASEVIGQAVASAQSKGARIVGGVATAAFRAAENGQEFLDKLNGDNGINLRMIDGGEELRLSYVGARGHMHAYTDDIIFADGGAGSTEIAQINFATDTIKNWASLKLGVLTHIDDFPQDTGMSEEMFMDVRNRFAQSFQEQASVFDIDLYDKPLVVAGSAFRVVCNCKGISGSSMDFNPGLTVSKEEVEDKIREILPLTLTEKEKLPFNREGDALVFLPAATKCLALMDACEVDELQTVPSGLAVAQVYEAAQEIANVG